MARLIRDIVIAAALAAGLGLLIVHAAEEEKHLYCEQVESELGGTCR